MQNPLTPQYYLGEKTALDHVLARLQMIREGTPHRKIVFIVYDLPGTLEEANRQFLRQQIDARTHK